MFRVLVTTQRIVLIQQTFILLFWSVLKYQLLTHSHYFVFLPLDYLTLRVPPSTKNLKYSFVHVHALYIVILSIYLIVLFFEITVYHLFTVNNIC